jgi:hypothetical protein
MPRHQATGPGQAAFSNRSASTRRGALSSTSASPSSTARNSPAQSQYRFPRENSWRPAEAPPLAQESDGQQRQQQGQDFSRRGQADLPDAEGHGKLT